MMVAAVLSELLSGALLANEGDGGPVWLLALGPAGAGAFYVGMWRYYRNTDRSHHFERETRIEAQPATGSDTKVNTVTGTRSPAVDGDNRSNHRQRVQRVD
jgi:hypothetical protein